MKKKNRVTHVIPYNVYGFKFLELLNNDKIESVNDVLFYDLNDSLTYSLDDYPHAVVRVKRLSKNLLSNWLNLLIAMFKSEIVIHHGLFDPRHIISYSFTPFVNKKLFWVVWGGDLYHGFDNYRGVGFRLLKFCYFRIGKKINNIVSGFDYNLKFYSKRFHSDATLHYAFYTYKLDFAFFNNHFGSEKKTIMVGNNATETNKHFYVLDKLYQSFKNTNHDYTILIPLSYGDSDYAKKVIDYSYNLFGDRLKILSDFKNQRDYNEILRTVDVAIMHHEMAAGLGVILQLLTYRKKVYLDPSNWLYYNLSQIGVKIFDSTEDYRNLLEPMEQKDAKENYDHLYELYSETATAKHWIKILNKAN
jgi:dTDP-N-acetylfucosamine:lipid II N-acetylfucosaminyltransferase